MTGELGINSFELSGVLGRNWVGTCLEFPEGAYLELAERSPGPAAIAKKDRF